MDIRNNKILTIIFILINIVIWALFIGPRMFTIISSFFVNTDSATESLLVKKSTTTKVLRERIDFNNLRDPFVMPGKRIEKEEKEQQKKIERQPRIVQERHEQEQPIQRIQRQYISRFRLKSIVQLKDKYVAALEEAESYDSQSDYNVPYSYRFGGGPESVTRSSKNYMVMEGDVIMEERVYKITEDSVILTKNNQYYKLTFSGGYPIDKP